jgi:hypothetical protein
MEAEDEISIDTSKMLVYGTPIVSASTSVASASTDAAG